MSPAEQSTRLIASAALTLAKAIQGHAVRDITSAHDTLMCHIDEAPMGPLPYYMHAVPVELLRQATMEKFEHVGCLLIALEEATDALLAKLLEKEG